MAHFLTMSNSHVRGFTGIMLGFHDKPTTSIVLTDNKHSP